MGVIILALLLVLALLVCLGSYEQKTNFENQGELHGAGYREEGVLSCPSWLAPRCYGQHILGNSHWVLKEALND